MNRISGIVGSKNTVLAFSILLLGIISPPGFAQSGPRVFNYEISIPEPAEHSYQVTLRNASLDLDTILLKMPRWMPGYYQLMDYGNSVVKISAVDERGKSIPIQKRNDHTWVLAGMKNKVFSVSYTILTSKQFVANSYVDSAHAYIIPENSFLYIEGFLTSRLSVSLSFDAGWTKIATGLEPVAGKKAAFTATDFDMLYDCPILIGKLDELTPFKVNGIEHRFIGYKTGSFDKQLFMDNLKKIVQASVDIIGDIPFRQYTFIGIGPGRGGIEHLNNTTISFDGTGLKEQKTMDRMMNFIAHEYFHHYNVKRIRPFELGPFDYENGNRTNLLWVSEGLSVYYEYLITKRAGLVDEKSFFSHFEANINAVENNPGRQFQSLQQASYNTWQDGPFGTQGNVPGRSISYYDKGPLVGLLLDFEIRKVTGNKKSLDDVMRTLYWKYYKEKNRGFTEAEFQQTCEQVAATSLTDLFEYVYTTKELDYSKYLAYGGLKLEKQNSDPNNPSSPQKFMITRIENPDALQASILKSWMGERN